MKIKVIALSFICLFTCASISYAGYILDAGEPDPEMGGPQLSRSTSQGVESYQWLARQFTLTAPYTIRTIECHLFPAGIGDGQITTVIYGDNPEYPYGPEESQVYLTKAFDFHELSSAAWHGLYNENLTLSPGDYWVAFEIRDPYEIGTAISSIGWTYEPGKPYLPNYYAFNAEWKDTYTKGGVTPFAVRIGDDIENSPVPEPATMALFGIGGLAAALMRRKKITK